MNEKNEYNKHTYTKRERKREHVVKTNIFYNWAELVYTFQKFNSYSFYKDWLVNELFTKKGKSKYIQNPAKVI